MESRVKEITFMFSGFVTADADNTSDPVNIAGARRVTFQFKEAGTVNNRSGVLTVTGQLVDGGDYIEIANLTTNAVNAITEGFTRVASITRNTAGSTLFSLPEEFGYKNIKVAIDVTDGGSPTGFFQVFALVEY